MEEFIDQIYSLFSSEEEILGILTQITSVGLNVIYSIIVFVVGWWIANVTKRFLRRSMTKSPRIDQTFTIFISNLVRYFILVIVLIAVLQLFGIETTSLVAVLGATSLAIGLALQGTLSHVAAGVMLLFFRPFKIGDYVEIGGQSGTVMEISLFTTELATPNNVQIILPNGFAWGAPVINYSTHPQRRLDLTIGIGYDDDMNTAIEVVKSVIKANSQIYETPEPYIAITNLGDNSVDVTMRVWCSGDDIWTLKFDLLKSVKEAFDQAGITIPYPQIDVHQRNG